VRFFRKCDSDCLKKDAAAPSIVHRVLARRLIEALAKRAREVTLTAKAKRESDFGDVGRTDRKSSRSLVQTLIQQILMRRGAEGVAEKPRKLA
jgi:hypothetical protein